MFSTQSHTCSQTAFSISQENKIKILLADTGYLNHPKYAYRVLHAIFALEKLIHRPSSTNLVASKAAF